MNLLYEFMGEIPAEKNFNFYRKGFRIPIRKEFIPFGVGSFSLWLAAFFFSGNFILSLPFLIIFLFLLNFFRDPERSPENNSDEYIVSPADGKVFLKDEVEMGGELAEVFPNSSRMKYLRIAIFMSPLDVHVNRSPVDGKVLNIVRKSGGFARAFLEKSEKNSRVIWVIENKDDTIFVVQIAGAIARRISVFKSSGQNVKKGERIGIIYLGSRVDLYLPKGRYEFLVDVGDRVLAGKTLVAKSVESN